MTSLVAGSKYLQKKVEKATPVVAPKIELPAEDEEEVKEEIELDEWTIKKLQHYAGIK